MQIRRMNATFGKLEQAELALKPGMNVIYAPNESGKSTWSHFIRSMLYGINTRDRSPNADKVRFLPWSGAAMRGRMELEAADGDYTLLRETRRAAAPLGAFSCTYTGTATEAPDITAQNVGEHFTGVSREVFERSAFIGQAALAVDQDAELERRIAALITTGEEDTSYSEAHERLKKQLNRRKHNRTGQIPALEREAETLDETLRRLTELQAQRSDAAGQMAQAEARLADLQAQQRQWELLAQREKLRRHREAAETAEAAQSRAAALARSIGPLPDSAALSRLETRCAALTADSGETRQARQAAADAETRSRTAADTWRNHPLYPADEAGLRDRLDRMALPKVPVSLPFWGSLAAAILAAILAALSAFSHSGTNRLILFSALCLLFAAVAVIWGAYRRRVTRQRAEAEQSRLALEQQIAQYLPLRQTALDAAGAAAQAAGLYDALHKRQQDGTVSFLAELSVYRAAADLETAAQTIAIMRQQADELEQVRREAHDADMRRALLAQQLPESPPADVDMPAAPPAMSQAQLSSALPQAAAHVHALQSRLDTLTGQLRSLGDPNELLSLLRQKQEELERLQDEYDAVALAMSALDSANLTLQNRFSPALGARAAEIFAGITGGRYEKVLLSRDFSLTAEPAGDAVQRSVRFLSQGAADQLYLSVRLAICDMVLPEDKAVPLILDDALASFDDTRLYAALDYLLRESQTRQVLLFTCHRREQDYLAGRTDVHFVAL